MPYIDSMVSKVSYKRVGDTLEVNIIVKPPTAINFIPIQINLLPPSDLKQRNEFAKLFHKKVVLKQVNSGILWEIVEIREWEHNSNGPRIFAVAKSLKSGYKKSIWPGNYDRFKLHDAPKTVKVLFGNRDVQNR